MRKLILSLALLALFMPAPCLAEFPAPSGLIVDNQGQQIMVERFDKLLDSYPYVYEDSEMAMPMSDVESLTYHNDDTITLVTTKGQSFRVTGQMGICYTDLIHYQSKNPMDGSLQAQTIDPFLVSKIIFAWKKK